MGRAIDSLRLHKARRTALVVIPLTLVAALWGSTNHAAPKQEPNERLAAPAPVVLNAAILKKESVEPASLLPLPNVPVREWRVVENKFWQIAGPASEDPAITDAREQNRGACGPGMI